MGHPITLKWCLRSPSTLRCDVLAFVTYGLTFLSPVTGCYGQINVICRRNPRTYKLILFQSLPNIGQCASQVKWKIRYRQYEVIDAISSSLMQYRDIYYTHIYIINMFAFCESVPYFVHATLYNCANWSPSSIFSDSLSYGFAFSDVRRSCPVISRNIRSINGRYCCNRASPVWWFRECTK